MIIFIRRLAKKRISIPILILSLLFAYATIKSKYLVSFQDILSNSNHHLVENGHSEFYTEEQLTERYNNVIVQLNRHWDNFLKEYPQPELWHKNCELEDLEKRFEQSRIIRWKLYFTNWQDYNKKGAIGVFNSIYATPDNWSDFNSRYPYPLAFNYNLALDKYSASLILIGNHRFIAIEAPSNKNAKQFSNLLQKYRLSHFVKLNSMDEYDEDYYDYWGGNNNYDPKETINSGTLDIFNHKISFYSVNWPHRKSFDPKLLLDLVQKVKVDSNSNNLIGVSCRGGVSRTCSFMIAYAISKEIDKQIAQGVNKDNIKVNLDEIIWKVAMQRPFAIAHLDQYIALHKFIDIYIDHLFIGQ